MDFEKMEDDEIIITTEEMNTMSHVNEKGELILYTKIHSQHEETKRDNLIPYSDVMLRKVKATFPESRAKVKKDGKTQTLSVKSGHRVLASLFSVYMTCAHGVPVTASIPKTQFKPNQSLKFKIKSMCDTCFQNMWISLKPNLPHIKFWGRNRP
jgi:hypothetical protein